MSLQLVWVSGTLYLPGGSRAANASIQFKLNTLAALSDGFLLAQDQFAEIFSDENGEFRGQVAPNPPGTFYNVEATAPKTEYRLKAGLPGELLFRAKSVIPGTDCQLSQTLQTVPAPPLDASESALRDLQAALGQIEVIRQNIVDLAATIGTGTPGGGTGTLTSVSGSGVVKVADGTTAPVVSIEEDADHRFVTDTEKAAWGGKQAALGFTPEQVGVAATAMADHLVAPDPHSQYTTAAELASALGGKANSSTTLAGYGITDAAPKSHSDSTANPHSTTAAQVGADATGTAVGLMTAHAAASDPHTQYTTADELAAAIAGKANSATTLSGYGITDAAPKAHSDSTANPHSTTAAQVGADATGTAAGLLNAHSAAADPHPGYALESALPANTDGVPEGATNLYFTVARVRAALLAGLSTATGTVVTAAHSVLQAIGFLQKQVSDNAAAISTNATAISGKQDTLVSGTNLRPVNGNSLLGSTNLVIAAAPGGSTGQVQFNSSGVLAGDAAMTYDSAAQRLTLGKSLVLTDATAPDLGSAKVYFGAVMKVWGNGNSFALANPVYNVCWSDYPSSSFAINAGLAFGFSSGAVPGVAVDTLLYRDAADTFAQRRGVNPQTKRVYGTHTDASNFRRVALAMTAAGVATLKPEGGGTGASGNVLHISGLPTSNPGPGILWNNAGTVSVGT